jgi:nicotinate-nucleotide pyrophosphorylase (carboxylating)
MELTRQEIESAAADVVARALSEDIGLGDLTSRALFGPEECCRASVLLKEQGVVCGLAVARAAFRRLDESMEFEPLLEDGALVGEAPREIARLSGHTRAILGAERVALNLLGRLSGIATLTRAFVAAVEGTGVAILDTRKTTPGLRALEKYAVQVGGGVNHRLGLAGGVEEAIRRLRGSLRLPLEVEAETLEQVDQALELGVERILLDNMSPSEAAAAVKFVAARAQLEVSGGVTLENVRAYAETGVNAISVGALTHSARSLDISLEVLEA